MLNLDPKLLNPVRLAWNRVFKKFSGHVLRIYCLKWELLKKGSEFEPKTFEPCEIWHEIGVLWLFRSRITILLVEVEIFKDGLRIWAKSLEKDSNSNASANAMQSVYIHKQNQVINWWMKVFVGVLSVIYISVDL